MHVRRGRMTLKMGMGRRMFMGTLVEIRWRFAFTMRKRAGLQRSNNSQLHVDANENKKMLACTDSGTRR